MVQKHATDDILKNIFSQGRERERESVNKGRCCDCEVYWASLAFLKSVVDLQPEVYGSGKVNGETVQSRK
jgi:hypothetical protein